MPTDKSDDGPDDDAVAVAPEQFVRRANVGRQPQMRDRRRERLEREAREGVPPKKRFGLRAGDDAETVEGVDYTFTHRGGDSV